MEGGNGGEKRGTSLLFSTIKTFFKRGGEGRGGENRGGEGKESESF